MTTDVTERPTTVAPSTAGSTPDTGPATRHPWTIVAQREIMAKLTDRTFIISTLVTLLLIAGSLGAVAFMSISSNTMKVAVVDASGRSFADKVGAIVAMFGTFFSNLMSGFSGWAPLLPYYMINMALAVTCFGIATKKFGKVPGIIVGTIVNTLCIAPWPLMMGWAMLIATIIQQVLGSYANCLLASLAYTGITAAQTRRRYEEPVDAEEARIVDAMLAEAAKSKPGVIIAEPARDRLAQRPGVVGIERAGLDVGRHRLERRERSL